MLAFVATHPPDDDPYQSILRKAEWISQAAWGLCLVLIALAVAFAWQTALDSRLRMYWWEILGTLACFWLAYLYCVEGARQGEIRKTRALSLDEQWLEDLASGVAAQMQFSRAPVIRIARGMVSPAWLSAAWLAGAPRIVIRESLVRYLEKGELASVIAHELTHEKMLRRYYGDNVFPCGAITLMAFLAWLTMQAVHTEWGVFAMPVVALLLGVGAFFFTERIAHVFLPLIHAHEFLADHEAARCSGRLNTINALLKVGQRQEMLHTVMEALADGHRQRDASLREEIFDSLPEPFMDAPAVRAAARECLSRRGLVLAEPTEAAEQGRKIDWRRFAAKSGGIRLEKEELEELVHALVRDGGSRLFHLHDEQPDLARHTLHPSLRKRLLFLCSCHHLEW